MKLVIRRTAKGGMLGKGGLTVALQAELSPEERTLVREYELDKVVLTEAVAGQSIGGAGRAALGGLVKAASVGGALTGMGARAAKGALVQSMTVEELVGGKNVECKDIEEVVAAEAQGREAAAVLKALLGAAGKVGQEEVIEM